MEKDTHNSEEVIDVEEYAKAGKPVPKGQKYQIRIDKTKYTVTESSMKGREILKLADKTPEKYHLYEHFHRGQTKQIQPDERVDFTEPGVERFTTMKIENTEG